MVHWSPESYQLFDLLGPSIDSDSRLLTAAAVTNDDHRFLCRVDRIDDAVDGPAAATDIAVEGHDRCVKVSGSQPIDQGGQAVTGPEESRYDEYRSPSSAGQRHRGVSQGFCLAGRAQFAPCGAAEGLE